VTTVPVRFESRKANDADCGRCASVGVVPDHGRIRQRAVDALVDRESTAAIS
jgi:hypothetical protein